MPARLLVFVFLQLLFASYAFAFPQTPILDTFNRADEIPIAGIWTNGTFGSGSTCHLESNSLNNGIGSESTCYVTASFSGSLYQVYATLPNATTHAVNSDFYLDFCLTGTLGSTSVDGYSLKFKKNSGTDFLQIMRYDGGVRTGAGGINRVFIEIDDNDRIGASTDGAGNFTIWLNSGSGWSAVGTETDATYSCANSHVGVVFDSGGQTVDNFGGGVEQLRRFISIEAR